MADKNYTDINNVIGKPNSKQNITDGRYSKESEPGRATVELDAAHEIVEHEPEPEVKSYVNPRAESIELPPDLKKLGVQSNATTQFPSYQNIKLPLSDEKVMVGLHAPITSSIRWLATLAIYLLAKAHLGLKVVKGKVIRVLKS